VTATFDILLEKLEQAQPAAVRVDAAALDAAQAVVQKAAPHPAGDAAILAILQEVIAAPRGAAEEGGAHPLLAELQGCFGDSLGPAWVEAESLQSRGVFAGVKLPSRTLPAAAPPAQRRDWLVPTGLVGPRDLESASGMETLLGCKLKWVLQYAAKLYACGPATLPDAKRLTGTFLHEVMSRVLTNGYTYSTDALAVERGQKIGLRVRKPVDRNLGLVPEAQLIPQTRQFGEFPDHRFDISLFDEKLHLAQSSPSARAATTGQPTTPAGSRCFSASSFCPA
jgi:hypothetical protein